MSENCRKCAGRLVAAKLQTLTELARLARFERATAWFVALQADGSAMYTLQALWTMAREALDITVVLLNNRSYAILNIEMERVGVAESSTKARSLLDLSNPDLDWVKLAEGMGVAAEQVVSVEQFDDAMSKAIATPGPYLIEVILPGYESA